MKKLIFILMLGSLFAQNLPPQSDIDAMSAAEKMMLYENNKKNPLLSMLFPHFAYYSFKNKPQKYIKTIKIGYFVSSLPTLAGIGYFDSFNETDGWALSSLGLFFITNRILGKQMMIETEKYNDNLYKTIYGKVPPN